MSNVVTVRLSDDQLREVDRLQSAYGLATRGEMLRLMVDAGIGIEASFSSEGDVRPNRGLVAWAATARLWSGRPRLTQPRPLRHGVYTLSVPER